MIPILSVQENGLWRDLSENGVEAGGRVGGVEGDVGRANFEHGKNRNHRPLTLVKEEGDD
jgi:hypothetical protein